MHDPDQQKESPPLLLWITGIYAISYVAGVIALLLYGFAGIGRGMFGVLLGGAGLFSWILWVMIGVGILNVHFVFILYTNYKKKVLIEWDVFTIKAGLLSVLNALILAATYLLTHVRWYDF